jgi:1-acyl-sn-glycerol-3-phosphate acyltransferase
MPVSKELNRYWRIFATGFCFSVFGIGALILASSIFPTIALFVYKKKQRSLAIRAAIKLSFKFFVGLMSFCGLISVRVQDFAPLKNSGGKIIIANHPSLIDIVILISLVPQSDCIVKASLGKNFFMRHVIKAAYILASKDIDNLFADCNKSLKDGNSLIIFPEGTRTVPGKKSKLSRGSAQLALRLGVDILPIRIDCHPSGLLKNQKWYDVAESKMQYVITAEPDILIEPYLKNDNYNKNAKELTDVMRVVLGVV